MSKTHESETEGYSASQIAKGVAKVAVIGAAAVSAAYLGACAVGIAGLSLLGGAIAGTAGAVTAGAYVGAIKGKKGFAEAATLTTKEVATTAAQGAALGVGAGVVCGAVAGVGGAVMGAVGGAAIGGGVGVAAAIEPKAREAVNGAFDKVADGAKAVADVITSKDFFKSVALGSAVGITLGVLAILAAPATFGGSIAAAVLVLSIGAIAGGYIGGKINQRNEGKGWFSETKKPDGTIDHSKTPAHGHGQAQQHTKPTPSVERHGHAPEPKAPSVARHTPGTHAAEERRRTARARIAASESIRK
jgi:hypothetical protein